jgi:hypothetical protein
MARKLRRFEKQAKAVVAQIHAAKTPAQKKAARKTLNNYLSGKGNSEHS